jgi:hypothetical protein
LIHIFFFLWGGRGLFGGVWGGGGVGGGPAPAPPPKPLPPLSGL